MEKRRILTGVFQATAVIITAVNNMGNRFYSFYLPGLLVAGIIYSLTEHPYSRKTLVGISVTVLFLVLTQLGISYAFRETLVLPLTATAAAVTGSLVQVYGRG